MKALIRYAVMKGMRDGIIAPLLFAPSLLFVSPLLVTSLVLFTGGRDAWPARLPGSASAGESALILTMPAILFGTVIAGVAAYWIFRLEIGGRAIGFFLLAQPAVVVTSVAVLFGTVGGATSSALAVALISLLTESPVPVTAATMANGFAATAVAAALGALSIGISTQGGVLIPAAAASIAATFHLLDSKSTALSLGGILLAAILTAAAAFVWRRRCAI